jgi:D-sedoheptulose 7-phosphate isomerase
LTLSERIRKAKHVYIIGNGGSYANAIHIANDLIACGIRAHTLDPATLTAIANDNSYTVVFSKWLFVMAEAGDMLIALSGSGKSPNILNAVRAAQYIGMDVYCMFGAEVGYNMQEAEEAQIRLGHALRGELR